MGCVVHPECGGCLYREMDVDSYQNAKAAKVKNILDKGLSVSDYVWQAPVFLPDGMRRRASFAFQIKKGQVILGFNENRSSQIVNCERCLALKSGINALLPSLRHLLQSLAQTGTSVGKKGKVSVLSSGDILVLEADNGLDVVLEADISFGLAQREAVFDFMQQHENVLRFSFRRSNNAQAEPIIEKMKPSIMIGGTEVLVAPGMFLQPSKNGEETLTRLAASYLKDLNGQIADLFCGIGTFSYVLAQNKQNQIDAADMSEGLLKAFQESLNRKMVHNVHILRRNLFKYPFDVEELAKYDAVLFDPPRAGAAAQAKQLSQTAFDRRPQKIVAVSCNPHSFVNDANVLISGGYKLKEVTMVDQFVFSNHSELVALFEK